MTINWALAGIVFAERCLMAHNLAHAADVALPCQCPTWPVSCKHAPQRQLVNLDFQLRDRARLLKWSDHIPVVLNLADSDALRRSMAATGKGTPYHFRCHSVHAGTGATSRIKSGGASHGAIPAARAWLRRARGADAADAPNACDSDFHRSAAIWAHWIAAHPIATLVRRHSRRMQRGALRWLARASPTAKNRRHTPRTADGEDGHAIAEASALRRHLSENTCHDPSNEAGRQRASLTKATPQRWQSAKLRSLKLMLRRASPATMWQRRLLEPTAATYLREVGHTAAMVLPCSPHVAAMLRYRRRKREVPHHPQNNDKQCRQTWTPKYRTP